MQRRTTFERLTLCFCSTLLLATAARAKEPAVLRAQDPLDLPPPAFVEELVFPPDERSAQEKVVPSLWTTAALRAGSEPLEVIVTLHEPQLASTGLSVAQAEERRVQALATLAHRFAAQAEIAGLEAVRGLSHMPIVFGRVPPDRVLDLAALPEVFAIEEDRLAFATRVEGGNLIRAPRLRTDFGATGAGVGVAVLDTGIDATHPEFGNRVVAHADFTNTTGDGRIDDNGHGTAAAGIIAGAAGGMAPQARLWAVKVLDGSGRGPRSNMIAALNTLFAERNNFGGLHVVNMSLGEPVHFNSSQTCDVEAPGYAAAANQLLDAGITIFVSSGNEAVKNGVAIPACLSATIAVGAVYDANLGQAIFDNCADELTGVDRITCYSNSGSPLHMLAPSHCARTPAPGGGFNNCFGGTSAAAPYAAGVAAQLLSIHPGANPFQLFDAMANTGRPLTDVNGITRNRIDALAAHVALTGGDGSPCVPDDTTLCIDDQPGDRRFRVTLEFENNNTSGDAKAIALASLGVTQGGLFWISNQGNPEVLIKILNACVPPFNRYWVFYAATTNQGLATTVTDTFTGRVWIRTNPNGSAAPPVQDTNAFPCT